MNIIPYPKTIFLVGGDDALSQSLKCLLETQDRAVEVFRRCEAFWKENVYRERDVILLNFERNSRSGFKLLNSLLSATRKPQIIVTSHEDSVFRPDDHFVDNRVTVLIHPVTPGELVKTIERLLDF